MEKSVIPLDWDSRFFHRKIGRLSVCGDIEVDEIDMLCREYDMVYLFSDKEIMVNKNCLLVDKKRTYLLEFPQMKPQSTFVKKYVGNPTALYDIAFQAGHESRFKVDPAFSEEEFESLYTAWIDNSLRGIMADYVLTYHDFEQSAPRGLITAKKKNGRLQIGLFATDTEWRRHGVGAALIDRVISIGAFEDLPIEVTTQADNEVACRFYERKGFMLNEQSYVYHYCNKRI